MQQTNTSVLARRVRITGDHSTLPYEMGWAREAVIFVQAEGDHPDLMVAVEVSPDGIAWIRRGERVLLRSSDALAEVPLETFGNWVRVTVTGATPDAGARILIHINGKG